MNEVANNKAVVIGKLGSAIAFCYKKNNVKYYTVNLDSQRLSGVVDNVPILVPQYLTSIIDDYANCYVKVSGRFCSYTLKNNGESHLILSLSVDEITEIENPVDAEKGMTNHIYLKGFICKPPVFRITPHGRIVTDIMLAINYENDNSDYIPCICWDNNAKYAKQLKVGDSVAIHGRVQSRTYQKKLENNETESRVAYEVSVNKFDNLFC